MSARTCWARTIVGLIALAPVVCPAPAGAGGDIAPVRGAKGLVTGYLVRTEASPKKLVLVCDRAWKVSYPKVAGRTRLPKPWVSTVSVPAKTRVSIWVWSKGRRAPATWGSLKPGLLLFVWTTTFAAPGNSRAVAIDISGNPTGSFSADYISAYEALITAGASAEAKRLLATQDSKRSAAKPRGYLHYSQPARMQRAVSEPYFAMLKAVASGTPADVTALADWLGDDPKCLDVKGFGAAFAAGRSRNQALSVLLGKRAPVTWRDEEGRTALHLAAQVGNAEGVGLLLKRGADSAAADKHGDTPLTLAEKAGKQSVVEVLRPLAAP